MTLTATPIKQKHLDRLDEIFALTDGWYEKHSVATTEPAKAMALGILTALTEAGAIDYFGIFPKQDGGVLFEQMKVLDSSPDDPAPTVGYKGWVADIEATAEGPVGVYILDMSDNGDGTIERDFGDTHAAVTLCLEALRRLEARVDAGPKEQA
jgi:hypothetical protein